MKYKSIGWIVAALLAPVLVSCGLVGRSSSNSGANHELVGKALPDFVVAPLTGTEQPVSISELQGKVVLVNFWGTWCPPCREEFPHLVRLYQDFSTREDFAFVSISSSGSIPEPEQELRQATLAFLEQQAADLPTYADLDGSARAAIDQVGDFGGYPTTLLLDRQGIVRGYWEGYLPGTEDEIESLVANLLVQ